MDSSTNNPKGYYHIAFALGKIVSTPTGIIDQNCGCHPLELSDVSILGTAGSEGFNTCWYPARRPPLATNTDNIGVSTGIGRTLRNRWTNGSSYEIPSFQGGVGMRPGARF